jgi:hypothetical protein
LAVRSFDGIEVALLWSRLTDRLSVVVSDIRNGESFSFLPPREKALDAFYHPFAYAPRDAALDALAARGPVYA